MNITSPGKELRFMATKAQHLQLKKFALENDMTMSDVLRDALHVYFTRAQHLTMAQAFNQENR